MGLIYAVSPIELETLKAYIKTHLITRFIRLSRSLAGAPILFDKKLDSSFCLYIDYWGLNNLIIKNQYPFLLIVKTLDLLGQTKQFIKLDLTSAYYWMRILESVKWKTAFCTRYDHFQYQVMSFGLFNAPTGFQKYIDKILAEKFDIFVVVYLDNILIYTKDPRQSYIQAMC